MKKIIGLFLSVMLTTYILSIAAFASTATLNLDLRVIGNTQVGEHMTVELWCTDNPGASSLQFTLSYDKNVLKCLDCSKGELLRGVLCAENPTADEGAIVAAANATPIEGDGQLASYTFEVLSEGNCGFNLIDTHFSLTDGKVISYRTTGFSKIITAGNISTDIETEAPLLPFIDADGHWSEEYLLEGATRGILEGYPDGSCRPDADVTRAQFVTLLWRNVGEPEANRTCSFTDLDPNANYYHEAVAWAEACGYIEGVGNGLFLPDNPISRQEVALILWRVAGSEFGGELMFADIYDKHFTDSAETKDWAKHAVYWAIYNEVWCGVGQIENGNILGSAENSSRAEIVVMMVKYQEKIGACV